MQKTKQKAITKQAKLPSDCSAYVLMLFCEKTKVHASVSHRLLHLYLWWMPFFGQTLSRSLIKKGLY